MDPMIENALNDAGNRIERHRRDCLTFGTAEMGKQDHPRAFSRQFHDCRGDPFYAGGVGNLAILDGHIQVDTQQYALACKVSQIIECLECGHWMFRSSG